MEKEFLFKFIKNMGFMFQSSYLANYLQVPIIMMTRKK